MSSSGQKGLLVVNLGSPNALTVSGIRQFLRPFLMDKSVIDLPWVLRALIVYGLVLPFRPKKLIEQYREIWMEEGSPLLVYSRRLVKKLQQQLGDALPVELAMRYDQPCMQSAVSSLMAQGVQKLVVLPLYPQYAQSTTGSTLAELYRVLSAYQSKPEVKVIEPFYQEEGFIAAQAHRYQPLLAEFNPDHLLLSYHGLPVSHLTKDPSHQMPLCDQAKACPPVGVKNKNCYRAQSYATTRALAGALNMPLDQVTTVFQSRFGKNRWIEPATTEVLQQLAQSGVRRIAVAMPSFTVDCLETLEEIALRAKADWVAAGGEDMLVLPCLNDDAKWVEVLAQWANQA